MKHNIITERLKQLKGKRTLRKFTCDIGFRESRQSTVHNYLKDRDPKASFIAQVCDATGCDANWLLGVKHANNKQATINETALRMHLEAQIEESQKLLDFLNTVKTVDESQCKSCKHKCPHAENVYVTGCPAYVEAI